MELLVHSCLIVTFNVTRYNSHHAASSGAGRAAAAGGISHLIRIPPEATLESVNETARSKSVYRVRPDSKGRITLGKLAEGVSSYRVKRQKDGKIILEPFMEIPAEERWLWDNKEALESVMKGIEDARAGRTVSLGSFKKYLK
jgi:hypothetical protein